MTGLSIGPAGTGDLSAIARLYLELDPGEPGMDAKLGVERLQAIAAYPGSAVLVGRLDGEAVTTCTLIVIPNLTKGGTPYGLIENVVTAGAFRGRGFATALLKAAVVRAWEAGCYKVMLMTGSRSPATLHFYEQAGFEQSKTGFQIRRLAKRAE